MDEKTKTYLEGEKAYTFYNKEYYKAYKEAKIDETFEDIYNNTKFSYDGKIYKTSSIYIVKCEDKSVHLVDANNNDIDLITNKALPKEVKVMKFIDSSIFYDLYKDGYVKKDITNLNGGYPFLISKWDGNMHSKTRNTYATIMAKLKYKSKYSK